MIREVGGPDIPQPGGPVPLLPRREQRSTNSSMGPEAAKVIAQYGKAGK
jgi:hypothetical protein